MCNQTCWGRGRGGCTCRVNGSQRVRNGYMVKELHYTHLGAHCRVSPVTVQKLFWIQQDHNDSTRNNSHFAPRVYICLSVSYFASLPRCSGYSDHPSLWPVLISSRLASRVQPTAWLEKESPILINWIYYKMNTLL